MGILINISEAAPPVEEFSFSGIIFGRQVIPHTVNVSSPGADSMSVTLTWTGWGNLDLKIYNPSGVLVEEVSQDSGYIEQTTILNPEAGDWRIDVCTGRWGWAQYTLEGEINY